MGKNWSLLSALSAVAGIFGVQDHRLAGRRKNTNKVRYGSLSKEVQAFKIDAAEAKRRRKAEKRLKDAMK